MRLMREAINDNTTPFIHHEDHTMRGMSDTQEKE